jgi:hypothetical protein
MALPLVRGESSSKAPRITLITELGFYGNAGAVVLSRT